MDGSAGPSGELGRDQRVVARRPLRAETAAHEAADDTDLVLGQVEGSRDLVADSPEELGGRVDDEGVAFPLAHALVRLERVVEDALGSVLGLDDGVGFGEPSLDVPALVTFRIVDIRLLAESLIDVEQRLQDFPLDRNRAERGAGLLGCVRRDGRDRLALVVRLVGQRLEIVRADELAHAWRLARPSQVDPFHPRARVWASEDGRMQGARELDVLRIASLAPGARQSVDSGRRAADGSKRTLGPLLERVFLDDYPLLGVAALDLLLRLDQACHPSPSPCAATAWIARSIFGYVPQRHRFPAIACLIWSPSGFGFASRRADAETI